MYLFPSTITQIDQCITCLCHDVCENLCFAGAVLDNSFGTSHRLYHGHNAIRRDSKVTLRAKKTSRTIDAFSGSHQWNEDPSY